MLKVWKMYGNYIITRCVLNEKYAIRMENNYPIDSAIK